MMVARRDFLVESQTASSTKYSAPFCTPVFVPFVRLTRQTAGQRLQSHSKCTVQYTHTNALSFKVGLLVQTHGQQGGPVSPRVPPHPSLCSLKPDYSLVESRLKPLPPCHSAASTIHRPLLLPDSRHIWPLIRQSQK